MVKVIHALSRRITPVSVEDGISGIRRPQFTQTLTRLRDVVLLWGASRNSSLGESSPHPCNPSNKGDNSTTVHRHKHRDRARTLAICPAQGTASDLGAAVAISVIELGGSAVPSLVNCDQTDAYKTSKTYCFSPVADNRPVAFIKGESVELRVHLRQSDPPWVLATIEDQSPSNI